jgi:colicin import membrane protein
MRQRVRPKMFNLKKKRQAYGIGFILSLSLHILIGAFFILSLQQGIAPEVLAKQKGDIVQAVIIDENQVVAEVERLKVQEQTQKKDVALELAKAEEARKVREQEQIKMEQLKQEMAKAKAQEMERLAEIKLAKEKEKKQLDALKKEKEKEQKKLAALDDQRQAELDRVNQMRKEREKEEKKKATLKQQADLKHQKEEAARLSAEKAAALAAENRSRVMREAERILEEWKQNVRNNKRETLELAPELACTLSIRLLPDGSFQEVRLLESSGNTVFDDSVIHAVYKTPVTMPEDVATREELKYFTVRYTNVE